MDLRYKIWLDNHGKAFGEGPYQLLKGIQSTGSLSQAAKAMNMSYSRAHTLMKTLGQNLGYPLIESQAGGRGGGLTIITHQAEDLMDRYDAFIRECDFAISSAFNKYFKYPPGTVPATGKRSKSPVIKTLQLNSGEVVALVGGGGKTSILFTLAEELALSGYKVVVATTTHYYFPSHGAVDRLLVFEEKELMSHLPQAVENARIVALGTGVHNGKLLAVSDAFVKWLKESQLVDFILVEADGASRKPFKAPADHEPVIPGCTDLVLTIVGVDILGKELNAANAHRPERISALTGLQEGEIIRPKDIAETLYSPQGGRKNVPEGARWLPVINKVDDSSKSSAAGSIASQLTALGAERVLFSSTIKGALKIRPWKKSK